ncbi:hypothetical protein [Citrobacter amalonaticus]|uniref:hypothetical protein n=1 Tax=Citrobacter amalonaticus TaxID=35703 RepID=UPI000A99D77B|nr:hypothetical protein [Citrobacter amalonaticus]MCX3397555.1 hypothetical protein [Citrobacter amalonaticus]MDQ2176957.1 hypothetical protein [Citrobacter amalonaticus]
MKMKKTFFAMGLLSTMAAGTAMAASGDTIGTGTLAVTGTTGTSTCSVVFPTSVTMPTITTSMFQAAGNGSAILQQQAGNIQFNGCNGQSVNIKVTANGGQIAGSKTIIYPTVNNKAQGWFGLTFGISTDQGSNFTNLKLDNTPSTAIAVNNDAFTVPVRVEAVKMQATADSGTNVSQGNYSSNFVVTATYA